MVIRVIPFYFWILDDGLCINEWHNPYKIMVVKVSLLLIYHDGVNWQEKSKWELWCITLHLPSLYYFQKGVPLFSVHSEFGVYWNWKWNRKTVTPDFPQSPLPLHPFPNFKEMNFFFSFPLTLKLKFYIFTGFAHIIVDFCCIGRFMVD